MTPDEKNKRLCDGCEGCCKHVAVGIDTPEDKDDYDNIIWFLLHENVRVFVDHDNDWYLEFLTKCSALDENKLCKLYNERPNICRKYSQNECIKSTPSDGELVSFNNRADFLNWLEKKGK